MAIKNKFIHFKTRAAFNANVPNPALTADEGNTFYNYTTFIQDTKEIYTHGTFYKSNTTWDMLKITEDISYAALFKNNAKVGDIVQLEGAMDFIIFSASIDNSSFMSLLQGSASDINTYIAYYDDSTQLYIFDEDSSLSIANNNNINSIVRSYVEDTYITEKTLEKLPAGTNASITATDSILNAFAKLQGQVNAKANTSSIPTAATVTPKASGTAAVGTSTKYAREDHVHPLQTNVATATKLATPIVIAIAGAVSGSATFDGSSNISINSTLNNFDASKITSGTLNADRLPEIPISKIPAAALERLYVVESQSAAMSLTIQEGDVVQIGSGGPMYFCVSESASTFATKFKMFTAGTASSVPWSGVTNAPTKLSQFTNDSGFITSIPAATTTAIGGIVLGYLLNENNYPVQKNSANKAFVHVPYVTTTTAGLMTAADKVKLDSAITSIPEQSWESITGKPTFATVATSGSYNDLTNKPTIPSAYTLPTASSTVLGGVKIGSGINISSGAISATYLSVGAAAASHTHTASQVTGLATVATSGSYNDLTNKPSIPSLSGYATQSWVTSQGYLTSIPAATSSAYGGIQIGYTTSGKNYAVQLSNGKAYVNVPWTDTNTNYYPTTFTWANGTTAGPTGSLTGSGMSTVSFGAIPSASATQSGVVTTGDQTFGGIKTIDTINVTNINEATPGEGFWIGYNTEGVIRIGKDGDYDFGTSGGTYSGTANTAKRLLNSLQFSNGQSFNGSSAVTIDLPEIPVALPNPYALTINGTSYTGSSAVSINTARILSTSILSRSTVSAGYSYISTSSRTISSLSGFSSSNPDSVIISNAKLTFTASNAIKMDGLDDLSGTWYIYCLSYMANGKIAVNGAVYA